MLLLLLLLRAIGSLETRHRGGISMEAAAVAQTTFVFCPLFAAYPPSPTHCPPPPLISCVRAWSSPPHAPCVLVTNILPHTSLPPLLPCRVRPSSACLRSRSSASPPL